MKHFEERQAIMQDKIMISMPEILKQLDTVDGAKKRIPQQKFRPFPFSVRFFASYIMFEIIPFLWEADLIKNP